MNMGALPAPFWGTLTGNAGIRDRDCGTQHQLMVNMK